MNENKIKTHETIHEKGKLVNFDSFSIQGVKFIIRGKFIKVLEVREEWDDDIDDPTKILDYLNDNNIACDIFTFIQRIPNSRPKYNYFKVWENFAAIPISDHEFWLWNQIPDKARNKIKKAKNAGIIVKKLAFDDDIVDGISSIYNESPVRQGSKNTQFLMKKNLVKKLNGTFIDRSIFIGAFYRNNLIAYLKIVFTDNYARIMGILGKRKYSEKSAMNLLISEAVKICCDQNSKFLLYARYDYGKVGSNTLMEFKRSNGFENIIVPRYFIPRSYWGKIYINCKLYLGIKNILPRFIVRTLLNFRKYWYEKCYLSILKLK